MVSAWRNFKNIFSRPLFTIIFRPEMLKFHPHSILTGDTMVRFVIFCVLNENLNGRNQIKSNDKFYGGKKSDFVDSGFVKTCDELVIGL